MDPKHWFNYPLVIPHKDIKRIDIDHNGTMGAIDLKIITNYSEVMQAQCDKDFQNQPTVCDPAHHIEYQKNRVILAHKYIIPNELFLEMFVNVVQNWKIIK